MHDENKYFQSNTVDLYALYLFRLVARLQGFTRAAEVAGLTQSAISRQIQTLERSLEVELFQRSTRQVRITPAGQFLYQESSNLLGGVGATLERLREEFAGKHKSIRVGVSQSIGLAYLPGFFHANLRRQTNVVFNLEILPSSQIHSRLLAHELDLGILGIGPKLHPSLEITHRFKDQFILIAHDRPQAGRRPIDIRSPQFRDWAAQQSWLLPTHASNTGLKLRRWLAYQGFKESPVMELDSFDLIITLVAMGMGASFVPIRALAIHGSKRKLHRVSLTTRFERELIVVTRRYRNAPPHLTQFIENILF